MSARRAVGGRVARVARWVGASALARTTFWSTRVGIKMGRGMRVVDEWFLAYAWVRDLDGVRVNTRVYDDGDVEDASASGEAERWSGDATMMEKIGSRRPSSLILTLSGTSRIAIFRLRLCQLFVLVQSVSITVNPSDVEPHGHKSAQSSRICRAVYC